MGGIELVPFDAWVKGGMLIVLFALICWAIMRGGS